MLATSAYPYPFSPPHPQAGYQPNVNTIQLSDDRQREQQRKRTYLSLLPTTQIVEICMHLEQYVPPHIRPAVWPADLDAAILALQKTSQSDTAKNDQTLQQQPLQQPTESTSMPASGSSANVASQQVHPPGSEQNFTPPVQAGETSYPTPSPATNSSVSTVLPLVIAPSPEDPSALSSASAEQALQAATEQTVGPVETPSTPADAGTTSQSETRVVSSSETQTPTPHTPQAPAQTSTSAPQASSAPTAQAQTPGQPQPSHPGAPALPAPYPYAPYGYPVQHSYVPAGSTPQAAYPHTPYYPPPGAQAASYPTHYPGYQPYVPPQPPYQPPTHQQHTTQQPPPPPPPQGEDLPSYEDMIVASLSDIGDTDGAAPKDIYTWIGARWPLQVNFRQSAGQALSKAFKRGRLEKTPEGRYRLNPDWEGGATSRRTTRRPQTLAQTMYALNHPPQQAASPFTHTPLPHRAHTSPPPPAPPPQHQPYQGYAYPYTGYAGYPGYSYGTQPANTSKATTGVFRTTLASKTTAAKTVPSGKDKETTSDEAGDAWEAAQHILQAINFGSLQNNTQSTSSTETSSGSSAAPPVMASLNFNEDPSSSVAHTSTLALGEDGLGRATLTDEERASLQAQLALLAAQLSEIANGGDNEDENEDVQDSAPTPIIQPSSSSPQELQYPPEERSVPASTTPQPLAPPIQPIIVDVNQFPEEPSRGSVLQQPSESSVVSPVNVVDTNNDSIPESNPTPTIPPSQSEPGAVDAGEESDEDEDMEMVDVDSIMRGMQT